MGFQIMAKPVGAACNLNCRYCYYTEKASLYNGSARPTMPPQVLERFIEQYITSREGREVGFVWQGGEPTLLGLDFFQSVVALQQKHGRGQRVTNSLQTNGTLLTDDWGAFLREHDFLVGLSLDGPRDLHDSYRVTKSGASTFDAVMSGLELLTKHGVAFNLLTVVNDCNSRRPLEVYRFLREVGQGHLQFIPAVERRPGQADAGLGLGLARPPFPPEESSDRPVTPWSVTPRRLADFYIAIFDEWVRQDVGRVFVQFFDVALANWLGRGSGLCNFAPTCGRGGVLEHTGDLYACDHYVYPSHKLGNIMAAPLAELMESDAQRRFGQAKLESLAELCLECRVRALCHGDCLKNRFAHTPDGAPGLSYLCPAYQRIFTHLAPYLNLMAELIAAGRPVPDIMSILAREEAASRGATPGRNDPCPCGSGKKYKKCCGA